MRIRDLLNNPNDRIYVGRETELHIMRNIMANVDRDWQMLHIYGPGGIGKTTLLRLFIIEESVPLTLYFDGHGGFHQPADFLSRLRTMLSSYGYNPQFTQGVDEVYAMADFLNEIAKQKKLIVLLFDTFELWGNLEEWLRDVWLPMLVPNIRVCSSGRYPLEGNWLRDGWSYLVQNVKLSPLSRQAIQEYAKAHGIIDQQLQKTIEYFSKGIPLALSLACEVITKQGIQVFLEGTQQKKTIGYLIQELVNDVKKPFLQKYLDVVSLLWTFNQDILHFILSEEIDNAVFREFCRLPFITIREEGWSLHDSVRNFAASDFFNRQPETYNKYRHRALMYLRKLTLEPHRKHKLTMDKLFLNENELVRNYCFTGDEEGIEVRQAKQSDMDRMEELCFQFFEANGVSDDFHQFIRPIWEADSSSFFTLWKDDELVAFYQFTPLHKAMRDVLIQFPVTYSYISKTEIQEKEYIMFMVGLIPSLLGEIGGALARIILNHITKAKLVIDITPLQDWISVMRSVGFEPLPCHDYQSPSGITYHAFKYDLREVDFETHIDHLLDGSAVNESVSLEEVSKLMKSILTQFHTFETNTPLVQSFVQILHLNQDVIAERSAASVIREKILYSMDNMSNGSKEDQLFHQMLTLAYIKKIGSHEAVADRLQLTMATYYRYLKKSIHRLSQEFIKI